MPRRTITLFIQCLVDAVVPEVGEAMVSVLRRLGLELDCPTNQTCCGQPGYNSGDRASAQALARKVLDEFEGFDYVVAPSGSCAGMIRTHYPELFHDAPDELERVRKLCERTYELTDFLVSVAKLGAVPGNLNSTITYHDSCAGLRELSIKGQPRQLLAKVPGLKLIEMEEAETCCGFGGTFSVKFGEISTHIAERKCANIAASGAETVVLGDLGCMLNIEGRLRRRGDTKTKVLHIAEVLAGSED